MRLKDVYFPITDEEKSEMEKEKIDKGRRGRKYTNEMFIDRISFVLD